MNNDVFIQSAHLTKCQSASIACSVPVWRVSPFTARHRPFGAVFQHCYSVLQHCTVHIAHCMLPSAKSWANVNVSQCKHPTCWLSTVYCALHTREGAEQRCSISARSEPFQRLLRTHCRAWLSSAVQTSEMHASDDKVGSANSLNQIHCRASLRCLQMAPVFEWTTFSNPRQ